MATPLKRENVRALIRRATLGTALAGVVAAGLLAVAAPAASASGCSAIVQDSPTPVHAWASPGAPVAKWKYRGQVVTGNCYQLWAWGTVWDQVYCQCVAGGQAWIANQHLYCYNKFNCV
jgi:hypothetical protein